jgi:glycosyltransferase involved in cell wall biosynthesis
MHIVECLTHSKLGGGQQVVYTLVKNLKQYFPELKITVILPSDGVYVERFRALGIDVREFPCDKLTISSLLSMSTFLKSLNADVIHSHGKGAGFYARLSSLPHSRTKRVHSYHGFHPPSSFPKKQLYLFQELYLLHKTDKLVMVSQSESEEVAKHFSSVKNKMCVIPNVVECEQGNNSLPKILQNFLDANKDSFIVTMIGRNDPIKNYPLAFQTMEKIFSQLEHSAFVIVGVGEDDEVVGELNRKYPQRIYTLESIESSGQVLRQSSVLLMTSKKEGSPLTILEAFCCGKPVVGTNVGGIQDVVADGRNGVLCPENPEMLAQCIIKLCQNKEMYERLSAGAFATAQEMNIEAWARKYYHEYTELLS